MGGVSGVAIPVQPFGGGDAACDFELLARFNAANQGYANGQVLDTAAEGVAVGSLTVVETDGVAELLNNQFRMSQKMVNAYNDLGLYSTLAVVRALGKALFVSDWELLNNAQTYVGWNDFQDVGPPGGADYAIGTILGTFAQSSDSSGDATVGTHAQNTPYELALVLGGYDINQQPWYEGAIGTFISGCSAFIRGGIYVDWTLLWRFAFSNQTPLYPTVSTRAIGDDVRLDDCRVPIFDYSAAHEPVSADWLTDPNGTSLDAHTPDVGGGWVEYRGDWDIQGNQARQSVSAAVGTHYSSAVESLESDLFGRVTVTVPLVDEGATALAYRLSDADNFWMAMVITSGGGTFVIREYNGGVVQTRASVGVGTAPGATVEVTVTADGQDMQAFYDGANRITFASVFNQAATKHGLAEYRSDANFSNDNAYDNFHVNPLTPHNALDNCP
jgi:hypothetical protein